MKSRFAPLLFSMLSCLYTQAQEKIPGTFNSATQTFQTENTEYWIGSFYKGYARISNSGYYGLMDSSGLIIVAPKYDEIGSISHGLFQVHLDRKTGLVNRSGREIIPAEYDHAFIITLNKQPCVTAGRDGKQGVLDTAGNILLPFIYEAIDWSDESSSFVVRLNEKYGLADLHNRLLCPIQYDDIYLVKNGYSITRSGKLYGFIDSIGRVIVAPKYDCVRNFQDGFAPVNMGGVDEMLFPGQSDQPMCEFGKWGFIDTRGHEVLAPVFDELGDFRHGIAMANIGGRMQLYAPEFDGDEEVERVEMIDHEEGFRGGKYIIIDTSGKTISTDSFDYIYHWKGPILVNKEKAGALDLNGRVLIPCKYDNISLSDNGYMALELKNKYALANPWGKSLTGFVYDEMYAFFEDLALVKRNGLYGFIDSTGREIIPPRYTHAGSFRHGLSTVRTGKKSGMINRKGKAIIPVTYDALEDPIYFPPHIIARLGKKYALISKQGKQLTRMVYDTIIERYDDYLVKAGSYYGVLDTNAQLLIPVIHDSLGMFHDGYAVVKTGHLYHFINYQNNGLPNDMPYDKVLGFSSGFCPAWGNGKAFLIDHTGKTFYTDRYDSFGMFNSRNLAKVKAGGKYGIMDKKGNEIVKPIYDYIGGFNDLAETLVMRNKKYGLIDAWTGREILAPIYDKPAWFHYEYCILTLNGKMGLGDREGHVLIPFEYEKMEFFRVFHNYVWLKIDGRIQVFDHKNMALSETAYGQLRDYGRIHEVFWVNMDRAATPAGFSPGNKWGLVDTTGKLLCPLQYDDVGVIIHGLFRVKRDNKYGFVNTRGVEIIPVQFDRVERFIKGMAEVSIAGKKGLIDTSGRLLVPALYDYIEYPAGEGLAMVKLNGLFGYVDLQGNVVIPLSYESASFFENGKARVWLNGESFYINSKGERIKN